MINYAPKDYIPITPEKQPNYNVKPNLGNIVPSKYDMLGKPIMSGSSVMGVGLVEFPTYIRWDFEDDEHCIFKANSVGEIEW